MRTYKLNQHQHIPEIVQQFQQWDPELTAIQFSTSLIPVNRGIMMTPLCACSARKNSGRYLSEVSRRLSRTTIYSLAAVRKAARTAAGDRNQLCDIGLVLNPMTHIVTVIAVIDNLVKGAAGQAIQNVNKWAGLEETAGLRQIPWYP